MDPRPKAIGHNPAGDLARRGPLQRFDHLETVVIRQPDIKDQVHVILRGIDVRDEGLNAGIGIRQQPSAIAAYRGKAIHGLPDAEQMLVTLRDLRMQSRRVRARRVVRSPAYRQHVTHPSHTPPTDIRLAEEKISDHTHDG